MPRPNAYVGSVFTVAYAERLDGRHPAKEFFDHLPQNIKIRFGVSFKKLGDTGKLWNKEQFKIVERHGFLRIQSTPLQNILPVSVKEDRTADERLREEEEQAG